MSIDLCEEMSVEIFSRLPAKSLVRFRSISKSLYGLIGSPDFIRLHAHRSPKQFVIIHYIPNFIEQDPGKLMYTLHSEDQLPYNNSSYTGIPTIDYPFKRGWNFFGSCNGILGLHAYEMGVHLWNPSTRRKLTISDPLGLPYVIPVYGFGFDPVIQDYKIVRISPCRCLLRWCCSYVCNVKTGTWRKIASPGKWWFAFYYLVSPYQLLFNGALHLVAKYDVEGPYYHHNILTFDFSSEVFSSIELPEPLWKTSGLAIIKGSLAVISSQKYSNDCRIWVRNNTSADASWSLVFKLDDTFFKNHSQRVHRFYQLTTANDDDDDDLLVFSGDFAGIKVYNPRTRAQSKLALLNDPSSLVGMYMCPQTLELLDLGISFY